jgi:peptide/nickel transport system substrate-binding protein
MRKYTTFGAIAGMSLAAGLCGVTAGHAQAVVKYVPQADINVLDPVVNKSPVVTQYGYMVYDQLFAVDGNYQPKPQMVGSFEASGDGKSYSFTLRSGLKFHDGQPVRSADATTSITRWARGDPAGQKMMAAGMSLKAVDDNTFTMTFEKPFRQAIEIMAKPSWPLFVYPERNNDKPNNVANNDAMGSGPFKFVHSEWKPGSKIVFVKNPDYLPRAEPADGYAGGKVAKVDRVEWNIIPDANTSVSALRKGEIDIVESIPLDFAKALRTDSNVTVAVFNKIGLQAYLRFNNIQPPFNNQKVRQALLHMVNQEDYMRAMIGDEQYWSKCWAYMMCGSPNGSELGAEAFKKPDLEKAKQLLKAAGYNGEKVVVLTSTGIFAIQDEGQVLVQELRSIGMNVEEVQLDFNTMLSRRLNADGVEKGGWSIIPLWSFGPDLANPLTSQMLTAPCKVVGWPGWACSPKLESLVDEWALSEDDKAKRAKAEEIQKEAIGLAATIPLGQFYQPVAYRKALTGFLSAPYPVMWNLEKK